MRLYFYPVALLLLGLAASYWLAYTPPLLSLLYLLASVVSYWLYAKDKRAAKAGEWRVPEKTLHLSALLGGWPGALIAQQRLRHKTQKLSFQLVFWVTVVLNLSPLVYVHTPLGSDFLQRVVFDVQYWVTELFGHNAGTELFLALSAFHESR